MASQKAMINTLMFYHWDNTLFDNMSLPNELDKNLVVQSILLETSDFPLVITDLETLKMAINVWSAHKVDIWQHLLNTTKYVYNPIENYNRLERETTLLEKRGTGSVKGDGGADTITYNISDDGTQTENTSNSGTVANTGDIIIENSATNTNSLSGSDELINSGGDSKLVSDNVTEVNSGTDETTTNETDNNTKNGYDETREGVSAFNEQNVLSDHTKTTIEYNSGNDLTINKTENIDYGKTTTTNRAIDEAQTYGKTETTNYGKITTDTGSNTETTTNDTLTTTANEGETTRTSSNSKTGSETHTHLQGNIETRNFDDTFTAERHITGNIGVMTTQDMIKQEREIALFDIIDIIVADYKSEFCILIY